MTSEGISRGQAWAWLALATLAFVVVAAVTVPWSWMPGGPITVNDPSGGLSPVQVQRADDLRGTTNAVGLAGLATSLVVAVALGFTSWGARLVRRLPGRWWWLRVVVAIAALLGIGRVATLPFAVSNERSYRAFGLSTQDWPGWALDELKEYALAVVSTAVALLVLVGLARRLRRWWLPGSVLAGLLVVGASFVYPVVVAPLFASTTPMTDGPLRDSLLEMAAQDGVEVEEVLVADESRRTTALNAYVAGFGATKRIVVYDTLVAGATADEVRLVVAHELGHSAEDDPLHGTVLGALGAVAGVTLLAVLVESSWWRRRSSAGGMADVAAVPLVLAMLALGTTLSEPLNNWISRAIEARADVHALELTEEPVVFEQMQRRLAVTNISDPDPAAAVYVWFASHPTLPQRLAIAERWEEQH